MALEHNIHQIKTLIQHTERSCQRDPGSVMLLAVSKQQSADSIRQAFHSGIHDFAENYLQEAENKIDALQDLPICWHFIGPIQSNKTKGIATRFDWVHSVDRYKIAQLLNQYRPNHAKALNVCLQINVTGEETKSGVLPHEASELALQVNQLPHLVLRGLMTIPPPLQSEAQQLDVFRQMTQLLHTINSQLGLEMDVLSMGMSDDLIPAIKAGATIVRIGRALFGDRKRTSNEN